MNTFSLVRCPDIVVKRDVAFDDTCENRLQSVVVLLSDRIEFVSVTTGTVGSGAGKRSHCLCHKIVPVEVVKVRRSGLIGAVVKDSRAEESECRSEPGFVGVKTIGSKLFANEPRPGLVGIQSVDHIVAESPCVVAWQIVAASVRLCKVNCIQPMSRPTFAIPGRIEQLVNKQLVSVH